MKPKNTNENQINENEVKKRGTLYVTITCITMLVLITMLAMVMIGILTTDTGKQQIANISKTPILGAEGTITESIGENVTASFDGSTVTISSTSEIGTIDSPMLNSFFNICGKSNVKTITFANEVYAPALSNQLFYGLSEMTGINHANYLDTSNVTSMNSMFQGCNSLTTLNLSDWDVSNVTGAGMTGVFTQCSGLETIDVTNWQIGNINMSGMFYGCSSLKSIDMSTWDMSGVTNTMMMFGGCTALTDIYTPKAYSNQTIELPDTYYNLNEDDDGDGYTEGTKVGEHVVATFNAGTGELTIASTVTFDESYSSFSAETFEDSVHLSTAQVGTIDNEKLHSLYDTYGYDKIITITFANKVYAPEDSTSLFENLDQLTSIEKAENLDISKVKSMYKMFCDCSNLISIDVSIWDTREVTDMAGIFSGCEKLESIDVGSWNTEKVTEMRSMFNNCKELTTIDVSSWETELVTDMSRIFNGCEKLESIDVGNWNTENVKDISYMFHDCTKLTQIDVSSWNTENVTTMEGLFWNCNKLTTLDVADWKTEKVINMSEVFYDCSNLETLDVSKWDTSEVTSMANMFNNCTELMEIDVSNWKTEKVTNIYALFNNCNKVTILDVTNWKTGKVTDMTNIFCNCSSLETLDVSKWDTSEVTSMANMFCNCSNLEEIDVSKWNTEKVTNMYALFFNCNKLTTLNVTNWETGKVIDMTNMFCNCSNLGTLNVSKWDTSEVTSMANMFNNCTELMEIDVSNWKTEKVTNMYALFLNCNKLTTLNLINWDMSEVTEAQEMFKGCTALKDIYTPKAYSAQTINLPSSFYCLDADPESGYTEGKTKVGDHVSATFDEEAKEVKIASTTNTFNSFTAGTFGDLESVHLSTEQDEIIGTLDKTMLKDFLSTCEGKEIITFENEVKAPENSSQLFYNLNDITTINANSLDTSNVKNMVSMFSNCTALETINVSDWHTENVTSMSYMFNCCENLQELNVDDWNTGNVTDMMDMFYGCSSLTELDLSNWNTGSLTNTTAMFNGCSGLIELDISNWDMSKVTQTMMMLNRCTSLTDIYTPNACSNAEVDLPSDYWYNVDNETDNNVYSSFVNNDNFTETVHLSKLVDYDIHYELDNGTVSEGNPNTYNAVSNFTLNNPAKEGYKFTGWTGSNGTDKEMTVTINGREMTGELNYTANYSIDPHVLTINPNGGTWNDKTENSTFELELNETKTIEDPERRGYTFDGWDISEEGSTIIEGVFTMGSKDVTLTAKWIPRNDTRYTVKHWKQTLEAANRDNVVAGLESAQAETIINPADYEFIEADNKTGTTGASVTPDVNKYPGLESPDPVTVEILGDGSLEVNYYYTRRADLSYTVNYIDKDEQKEIEAPKVVDEQIFGSEITTSSEVKTIDGYDYNSIDPEEILVIGTGENVINIYYIKKETSVIVHHYIVGTETKVPSKEGGVVEDVEIPGKIGEEYTATKSDDIPANYVCINEEPKTVNMTADPIEITFYYELITPTLENDIEITATANEKDETNTPVLTKERGEVTYSIKYTAKIKDYIGKARIEIVDTLPAWIDTDRSELAEGIPTESNHTITWIEIIDDIDALANARSSRNSNGDITVRLQGDTYIIEIEKQITVVYIDQDVIRDLVNKVEGKTTVYYPDEYLTKAGEELSQVETDARVTVKQNHKANFKLEKVWDDNEDLKGRRPESVTIEIRVMPNDQAIEKVLTAENDWKYEEFKLPKYNTVTGEKIDYIITERETEDGELEYYDEPDIQKAETEVDEITQYTYTITNSYKLTEAELNTSVIMIGTEEITKKDDKVNYTINLQSEIKDYVGDGKVKIVDTLPYRIDQSKSKLDGGIYNDDYKTITWEIELTDINTDTDETEDNDNVGAISNRPRSEEIAQTDTYIIDITKEISVVYTDIELEEEKMTNEVKGTVELYETEQEDEDTATFDTDINVQGKIIVRYVDIDTNKDIVDADDKTYTYEITGKIGTTYTAREKEIEGYEYVKILGDETGKIKEKDQEVIYYYKELPKGKLTVKYVDIDTEEEITYTEENEDGEIESKVYGFEIIGLVGEEYETEILEIPYYVYVKDTENTEGKLAEKEDTVIYYYRKMIFNFSIEKTLIGVTLNGKDVKISDNKLIKVELKTSEVSSTELIADYNIKVTNEGELAGEVKVLERIPKEFEIVTVPEYWKENTDGTLETDVELEVGESRDLSVTLKWINSEGNLGSISNKAELIGEDNIADFDDTNAEDDTSTATIVISIKTGWKVSAIIIITIVTSMIITGYLIVITLRATGKGPDIKTIRFLIKK